jgi:hypothetical protein
MGGIMDRDKLRRLVEQAHPSKRLVDSSDESAYEGAADMPDVDVSGLSVDTWNKFRDSAKESSGGDSHSAGRSKLRDRFKPRSLTGAGPTRPPSDASEAGRGGHSFAAFTGATGERGKLHLERLVPKEGAADLDDSHDLLVDDEHGIIGESDSGPDKDKD